MNRLDTCEGCGEMEGQAMTGPDGRTAFYVIVRCLHRSPHAPCEPSFHEHTPEHCQEVRDLVTRRSPSVRTSLTLARAERSLRSWARSAPLTDMRATCALVIAELDRLRETTP